MRLRIGKEKAVKMGYAIKKLKEAGYKISDARFRKVMHVIRVSGMVEGIVATSKGYYISTTTNDFESYIKSLKERIEKIEALKESIINQYEKFKTQTL